MVWRALTTRSAGLWPQSVEAAADVVGVKHDDALQEIIEAAEACAAGGRPAPFAAAEAAATTLRILRSTLPTLGSDAELVALWLASSRSAPARFDVSFVASPPDPYAPINPQAGPLRRVSIGP